MTPLFGLSDEALSLLLQLAQTRDRPAGNLPALRAKAKAFPAAEAPRICQAHGVTMSETLDEALRGITLHAARQMGLGNMIGTLEKGKEADLTILENDPYATAPERLMAIRVSETWVGGGKKFG